MGNTNLSCTGTDRTASHPFSFPAVSPHSHLSHPTCVTLPCPRSLCWPGTASSANHFPHQCEQASTYVEAYLPWKWCESVLLSPKAEQVSMGVLDCTGSGSTETFTSNITGTSQCWPQKVILKGPGRGSGFNMRCSHQSTLFPIQNGPPHCPIVPCPPLPDPQASGTHNPLLCKPSHLPFRRQPHCALQQCYICNRWKHTMPMGLAFHWHSTQLGLGCE